MTPILDFPRMLREATLRVTRPRVAVLEAVHANPHADTDSIIRAVRNEIPEVSHQAVYDSLNALTARTVATALQASQPGTRRVIACGGGVHNPVLMAALAATLPDAIVESTAAHAIDPDHVEAMGFAWLARQTLLGLPGNLPSVTGAAGPRVLGGLYPA